LVLARLIFRLATPVQLADVETGRFGCDRPNLVAGAAFTGGNAADEFDTINTAMLVKAIPANAAVTTIERRNEHIFEESARSM